MDHRQLFDDLVRFETDLWNGVDTTLRQACDLPLGSFNVMLVVERTSACRVNDVAEQLSITIGGASQAVDRLQARGLCERRANPADRRSSVVALTGAGVQALGLAGPVFDAELARWFEAADLGQFAAVLRELRGRRHA